MHWLFLNTDVTTAPQAVQTLIGSASHVSHACQLGLLNVYYDGRLWSQPPVFESDELTLVISGWFILEHQLNPLDLLAVYIQRDGLAIALQKISLGIFTGYVENKVATEASVFNDWFGLSAHYISTAENLIRIAPAARAVANQDTEIDEDNATMLEQRGHLWGARTRYKDVQRLLPGSIVDHAGKITSYQDYNAIQAIDLPDLPQYMASLLNGFKQADKLVSLSAGFDSRLLALIGQPSFAYTWGPEASRDVRNAKSIAQALDLKAIQFPFRQQVVSPATVDVCDWLLDAQNKSFQPQFYQNYEYAVQQASPAFISVDGYLGDTLQRGVYLYGSNLRGERNKLFPWLLRRPQSLRILKERYQLLNEQQQAVLEADFEALVGSARAWCPEGNLVTLFEFAYGRGFAHIYSGGIAMNGVHATVVAPFASPVMVKSFLQQPTVELANYKAFRRFWQNLDGPVVRLRSEGMYHPKSPRLLIPWLNFMGRVATNYIPYFKNYGKE